MKEHLLLWFKKAESDIKVAKTMLKVENPPTDAIGFHCQQAVEKYLKAYLTYKGKPIKKTHDLNALIDYCANYDKEFEKIDKTLLAERTFFAVEARYPDEYYMPDISETEKYLSFALKIKRLVMEKLNLSPEEIEEK